MKKRYKNPLKLLKRMLAKRNRWNRTFGLKFRLWNSFDNQNRDPKTISMLLRLEENSDLFNHFVQQKTSIVQKPAHFALYLNDLTLLDALSFMAS
jgi:hypothetical protein